MASSSPVQSVVDAGLPMAQVAQPPDMGTSAGVPEVPVRGEGADQEPRGLPEVYNLEWQREGMPDTEFNRTYPADAWGEEAGPNARVWKIYRDRQTVSDKDMLNSWNKTLDVLLIFAGLFSAVLTAFLIESYKALQPDYTQYVAAFLYAAAVSHNQTGGVFPALDKIAAPDRFVQTSGAQRWTNGLWFTSLVVSLAVALLCILIKQWLDAYGSHVSSSSPSPIHWARRHSLYHRGLEKWGVPGIISFLPLLLHLSLFLFFVGLILFLRPLDVAISKSLLGMVSCIGAFYILSLVLPAWRVECPSYTPLLAQALLAGSRAITILLYVTMVLISPLVLCGHRVRFALFDLAKSTVKWLDSMQQRARQQPVRETLAISERRHDLDGSVLRALIHLPVNTDRDVVSVAFAAIGAVTSSRTLDVISRNFPHKVFENNMNDCYNNLPSTATGFAITAYGQLYRGHQAIWIRNSRRWPFLEVRTSPLPLMLLGIDGLLLLQALDLNDAEIRLIDITKLPIRPLQSLTLAGDSARGFPLRSTCLLVLEYYASLAHYYRPLILSLTDIRRRSFPTSFFFLVFYAGRFASADRHELVRALRSVEKMLDELDEQRFSIMLDELGERRIVTRPARNGGSYICQVVDGVWSLLAKSTQHNIDTLTAQVVANEAVQCFNAGSYSDSRVEWVQLLGLSAFVRSPTFPLSMARGDNLAQYISLFQKLSITDLAKVPHADYWECLAILLKSSWDCMPRPKGAASLSSPYDLFPVEPYHWNLKVRLSKGGAYATQDDWYEPALSAFLTGPSAISTWSEVNSLEHDDKRILELASLAHRISIVLCRRQHIPRAKDTFIPALFSGSFLLTRFQELMSREDPPMARPQLSFEYLALDLGIHCHRLSAERLMGIVAQLEETGDAGSELRARAVAFAQRIRDGSAPGGALSADCNADCPCMLPGARAPPSIRARCDALVARFRGSKNTSMTPSNV